jgi:hypothetical protein
VLSFLACHITYVVIACRENDKQQDNVIIAGTTEYFHKIQYNGKHFDSTFRLYLVIIRNDYITCACVIYTLRNLILKLKSSLDALVP